MKVWNTLKTTYKVSDFIGWQRDGSLSLNPDFQRRSVWKKGAKSYLVDTIVRGFPIPMIFLRDRKSSLQRLTPERDVVDGQQRLRTVIAFVAPKLLKDFDPARDDFTISEDHNKECAGRAFEELPSEVQGQILDYQFAVNVFPSDTDDREVKQVFARMNSSGYKLNGQELRNAEYFGAFKTRAEALANEQLNRWRAWRVFSPDNLARMREVELSSEFIIVMLQGISEKDDKLISGVYEKYDDKFAVGPEVSRRFRTVFESIDQHLGDDVPKLFKKRTLFYGLLAAVYDLQYGIGSELGAKTTKAKSLAPKSVKWLKDAGLAISTGKAPLRVRNATTRRTTHARERRTLLSYLLQNA